MISKIEDLLKYDILWKEEIPGGIVFHAKVDGDLCILRMNDYPDEPMYTLMWREFELNIEDKPKGWIFIT